MLERIALTVALAAATVAPAAAASYGVGTSTQGTITYSAGAALAKVIGEKTKLDLRVQPYGGSSQYVPLVSTKEIDFGLANILEVTSAIDGKLIFEGNKSPNIRAVGVVFPLTSAFFVRADSDIKTFKDLKGKRITVGYSSQAVIRPISEAILAAGGLSLGDVKGVPAPNIIRSADDFIEGKIDSFYFGIGGSKVTQAAASVNGLRALPLDDTPEVLAAARKYVPQAYMLKVSPSDKNVGITQPTNVLTYDYLFIAGAHLPDDVVYQATKVLYEGKKELAATFPVFNDMNVAELAKQLGVPYHPGAIRFYKEVGLWKD